MLMSGDAPRGSVATTDEVSTLAEVTEAGEPLQVGEQVLTFLAGAASERVVFVIDGQLRLTDLALSVDSYTEP